MRQKHVPQRTCIACRRERPKRDLIRIVCAPDGQVHVDETGKANGRGAYLCRDRVCWEKGVGQAHSAKNSPLAHSLKASLSKTDRMALLDYAQQLPEGVATDMGHSMS